MHATALMISAEGLASLILCTGLVCQLMTGFWWQGVIGVWSGSDWRFGDDDLECLT